MSERWSYLEVDARIAEGDLRGLEALRGDPEWDEHLAATAAPLEVPEWARALERPQRRPRPRRRWLAAGALLAAALALLLLPNVRPDEPYVGAKGAASALLYVERAGAVKLWDGQRPLGPGDRFRIELADLGAPWFAVIYQEPGEPPVVLATGQGEGLLDGAWTFDAPAAGGKLLIYALQADPSGTAASTLLQRPPAVTLLLR